MTLTRLFVSLFVFVTPDIATVGNEYFANNIFMIIFLSIKY